MLPKEKSRKFYIKYCDDNSINKAYFVIKDAKTLSFLFTE